MSAGRPDPERRMVSIHTGAGEAQIETVLLGASGRGRAVVVFLHEGLGSISMWRDFPAVVCERLGCRALVYSRPGYGQSTPCARDAIWSPDSLHTEALQVLPALLEALAIDSRDQPVWLLGHSDGGSIALIHAAHSETQLAGAILLAPHILVEDLSVRSIELARDAFMNGSLKAGLARHHIDAAATFMRWNRTWLSTAFRSWSIEKEIAGIRCPLLAVQGLQDPYGTLEQVYGIARRVPGTRVVELPDCGHSPHRDQPEQLLDELAAFMGVGA